MPRFPDYHIHTFMCGHAVGGAEEYAEAAVELGLSEIGFAEHIPMYWLPVDERDPTIAMPMSRLAEYVETVLSLRERFRDRLTIRLGVEADYVPGCEEELIAMLGDYPWDYVYGSVHYIGDWGFDNPEYRDRYDEWDLNELYEAYFTRVQAAAATGLFDVMGHLDVIKKWGHRPDQAPTAVFEATAVELARCDVVVEANTAGYSKPVNELYPSGELLSALVRQGVRFTLGSDAHAPGEVGRDFEAALAELTTLGVTELVRFEGRRTTEYSIAPHD
ncbi:MAG: histidinol-phosphatase HisJ family protein [Chloroflexia bacterium]